MLRTKNTRNKSNLEIISDYLNGDRPYTIVGYNGNNKQRKIGEVWEDSSGKKWIQKNGYRTNINEQADIIRKARKAVCSSCGKDIEWSTFHLDKKMYNMTGKCYDCIIEEETRMRARGIFKEYENKKILMNMLAKCNEIIEQLKENYNYIETTKNKIEYQNYVGLEYQLVDYERWSNIDYKEILKDIEQELSFLEEKKKDILKELSEVNAVIDGKINVK